PRRHPGGAARARRRVHGPRGADRPADRPLPGRGTAVKVCRTIAEVRAERAATSGRTIGLVPTMGALHAGHVALLDAARAENEIVVMSLFVNPTQFSDAVDLNGYPRDEHRDLSLAETAGTDIVFAPSAEEMYPPGFQTWVDVAELGAVLEGRFRPGHFR